MDAQDPTRRAPLTPYPDSSADEDADPRPLRAVVVLGAAGNLGQHLCQEAAARGLECVPLTRAQIDLSRPDAELRRELRARLWAARLCAEALGGRAALLNAAAYTDVDRAEREEDLAYTVNALGTEVAAQAARAAGVWLCHVSTDFVFDGRAAQPYDEFDLPNPLGRYARSKHAGEVLLAQVDAAHCLVRVQGLYGRGGRNFVSTLLQRLQQGQALRVDRERRVQPTWTRAAARQILVLAEHEARGTYHVTCSGEATWFAFAEALCEEAAARGVVLPRTFQGVPTEELRSPAPRPAMSLLEHRMLKLRGLHQMPTWRVGLQGYLTEALS